LGYKRFNSRPLSRRIGLVKSTLVHYNEIGEEELPNGGVNGMVTENGTENATDGEAGLSGPGRSPGSRRTWFQKGNPGPVRRQQEQPEPEAEADPNEPVEMLKAMRKVAKQPKSRDKGEFQRHCRTWLETDHRSYLSKLADLEKAQRTGKTGDQPEEEDPGADRAIEAAERVLKNLAEKQERELRAEQERFVRAGLCATCGQPPVRGLGPAGRVAADLAGVNP
jgi:hypothetical protein